MKKFLTLLKYDIHKLIVSPSTYVIALIFSISIGSIFAFLLYSYIRFEQDVPFVQMYFRCFWLPTCVIIPLITMKTFSEEYKNGMFQSLFSVPVSYFEVIFSKFLTTYLFYIGLWLLSLILLVCVKSSSSSLISEVAFAAKFNVVGGLLFISLIGLFFISVGIFASSCTENQVISGMLTFFSLMAFFIGGQFLENTKKITNLSIFGSFSESLNIFSQLDYFSIGIVDSKAVMFYISSCVFALCLSVVAVNKKLN